MCSDTELADGLVAMGIGSKMGEHYSLSIPFTDYDGHLAPKFVRDPRVAMAVMLKCTHTRIILSVNDEEWRVSAGTDKRTEVARNESLPRAICEAGLEAWK